MIFMSSIKKVVSLSKDQEQALIQSIYLNLNRKTAGILIALFTGVRIGELCGLQMKDISLTDKTININKTVQRIYDKKKGSSYVHFLKNGKRTAYRYAARWVWSFRSESNGSDCPCKTF